ncbi:MAG: hypothetical protein OEQ39_01510, partial [Gammaproteobacteria bacterium]|nr:hypothetical protein [Gammaproteobacteria bacterium]
RAQFLPGVCLAGLNLHVIPSGLTRHRIRIGKTFLICSWQLFRNQVVKQKALIERMIGIPFDIANLAAS